MAQSLILGARMEWDDILNSIDAQLQDLFTLMAPTQPLTAIETLRAPFRSAVKAFQSNPTPEVALKAQQLADRLIGLAKQTPGFDLPSLAFQELVAEITAGLGTIGDVIRGQPATAGDEVVALRDFLQARLRSVLLKRPEKERDVQDALEQLLIGRGMQKGQDYDRETGRVKVATKELIPDYIFPKLGLALEVKLIADPPRTKAVIDEINADIVAYGRKYSRLLFLVYDMGFIRDEVEFRHGLENDERVSVIVVKH